MSQLMGMSPKARTALRGKTVQTTVPSALAADATTEWPIFYAERACRILRVGIVAYSTITGANTNSFNVNILNKGTAGVGTTEIGNKDFVSGTNATAFVPYNVVAESANAAMAQGEVLNLVREKVGTGMDMPALLVVVSFELAGNG